MIYCFDIDGTLCSQYPESGDYAESTPVLERIAIVNKLYDEGHKIILLTARGMGRTNNDQIGAYKCLYTFTENQLKEWGVKFHELFMGKPEADIFIDDKGMKDSDFFTN